MIIMEAVYRVLLDFLNECVKVKTNIVDNYLYELSVTLSTQMTVLTYDSFIIACNFFTALSQLLYDYDYFLFLFQSSSRLVAQDTIIIMET